MSWTRRLWVVLALLAIVGASATILASLYGDGSVSVDGVNVTTDTPSNTTANCEDMVIRSARVSVTVSRPSLSLDNPQFWGVGVSVRASVFDATKRRVTSVPTDSSRTLSVPFTTIREGASAPQEYEDAVIQVSQGSATIADETETVSFRPVKAGRSC